MFALYFLSFFVQLLHISANGRCDELATVAVNQVLVRARPHAKHALPHQLKAAFAYVCLGVGSARQLVCNCINVSVIKVYAANMILFTTFLLSLCITHFRVATLG